MLWDANAINSPHARREMQQDDCSCGGWTTGKHRVWCVFALPSQQRCTECQGLIGGPHLPSCPNDGAVTEAQTTGGAAHG